VSVLARIRAHGGDAVRDGFRLKLKRGRLSPDAIAWLQQPEIRDRLHREVWPEVDDWHERAAIREFDGGQEQSVADQMAYEEVAK